ncbi:hypothetical protein BC936DRAFT_139759 [Jimgerdemannia flammicorona]|uniref:Uncharacterized protein n=1 Tax=Jimgerdemannia flammicorona TaxID=994334 RepID=A0A433B9B3_9FUNG|nr:hypothetical protein BC936DRAFT_139759 [Jimgerdemannia flammicorona]
MQYGAAAEIICPASKLRAGYQDIQNTFCDMKLIISLAGRFCNCTPIAVCGLCPSLPSLRRRVKSCPDISISGIAQSEYDVFVACNLPPFSGPLYASWCPRVLIRRR